jgi:hypothetical protein
LLKGQMRPDLDHLLMSSTERHMQKTKRVKQRLRCVPEALEQNALRHLGRTRAVGVPAHAVDNHE